MGIVRAQPSHNLLILRAQNDAHRIPYSDRVCPDSYVHAPVTPLGHAREDDWLLHAEGGVARPDGVVFMGKRRPEEAMIPSPISWLTQLIDRSLEPMHRFHHVLEPTLSAEVTYSEVMEGRPCDPVYRGLA